jgi:hypothetical protein
VRRAYVVQLADGAAGSPDFPAAESGQAGDWVQLDKHEGRGAHGVLIRYLDQEDSPVVGPVPVLQWLAAPAPPEDGPFSQALRRARKAMADKAAEAHGTLAGAKGKAGPAGGLVDKADQAVSAVAAKADQLAGGLTGAAASADKVVSKLIPDFLKPTRRPWGTRFVPRVGSEVLVAHYLGRPDLPVIVGSLFTADIPRRFAPNDETVSIVADDERPLQVPDDSGNAIPRAVTARGRDLSYLDTSIVRAESERTLMRNMMLFDDGDPPDDGSEPADGTADDAATADDTAAEDEGPPPDNPGLMVHAEGDMVIDVRGWLDVDFSHPGYRFGSLYHSVGGTYRNVVKDMTCTTVLMDVEAHTQGDSSLEVTGLDFTLALNSLSSVAYDTYSSVEWSLAFRYVKPTYTDCTVGTFKGLSIIELVKPKKTLDMDHQGDHTVIKVLDWKKTSDKKTESVKTALELAVIDKLKTPKGSQTSNVEVKLALTRTLTQETHERNCKVEVKIAQTCKEQVGSKLEV